ncbi:DUF481 domain-containing protein [Vibrio sp.]|uniref:DUF481 domain-containing protein n=1 Tax=Vibrio sp. TaxID=678 RepID=UPI003D125C0C
MSKLWLVSLGLVWPVLSCAEEQTSQDSDPEPVSPWATEVEFGYQSHSGNSSSKSLNSRLSAEYTKGRYRTSGEWQYYLLYKNGQEDKRQSNYSLQNDYKLSPQTYLYASYSGFDSRYSAYFEDHTVSSGLGYQLINTEKQRLEIEIGPGYRYQEPNKDEIDDDDIIFPNTVQEAIIRMKVSAGWQPLETLSLAATYTTISGKSNTRSDTELSVINSITDDIGLKINYTRQHHDKVPDGLKRTETVFSVNLLFLF